MDNQKLIRLNHLINQSYECFSFTDFLKLAILNLHELVMFDSGMFYCGISKDCSFFKPYLGGPITDYYKKHRFPEREDYVEQKQMDGSGTEAFVFKSADYAHGTIRIENEPRSGFLNSQSDFYIACVRIVHKGQFLGEIYLHRSKDKPDFDDDDLFTLRLIQPHISTVFNIIHTVTAVQCLTAEKIPGKNTGICLFDGDLSLVGGNLTGVEMLKSVTVFGSSVLYHLKEICLELPGGVEKRQGNTYAATKSLKTPQGAMNIEIFAHSEPQTGGKTQYAVIMQYGDETKNSAEYQFKFTKREADLIDGLIQGKSNNQLAEAFNISANTVKVHVKRIFQKTGTNNRAELTYVLMINSDMKRTL